MPGFHLEARHFYVFVQVEYFPKQDMQKNLEIKKMNRENELAKNEVAGMS